MIAIVSRLVVALPLLASCAFASAETAAEINEGIADAVKEGKASYTLPAKVSLDESIVVPVGARNFALLGRKGGTMLKATKAIGYAITAGVQTTWNHYPVPSYPTAPIKNVPDRATSITLAGRLDIEKGDYLAVYDAQWVSHKNGDSQTNRMEIARVASVAGQVVTFDKPLSREYDLEPKVGQISDKVLVNLRVEGISFDASYPGGKNSGVLSVGLVSGLVCRDLATKDFGSRSMQVNVGSDLLFERVATRWGADIGKPGSGYGPTLQKCHRARFLDCESEQTRHGFMCTNGTTDVEYFRCRSLGTNGNFDTHGFDERRISWIECRATGTLNIGNTEYLGGGRDFLVSKCQFGFSCWVSANVKRVRVTESSFWGVAWQGQNQPKARPNFGRAEDVRFARCRFAFQKNAFIEQGDVDGLVFQGCTFVGGADPYTQFMTLKWTTGSITFKDCVVTMNNAGAYTPIVLAQSNADTFRLVMDNVKFTTKGSPWSAVQLAKGFRGAIEVRGSSVATARTGALFVDNQAGTRVRGDGGVVRKPAAPKPVGP